jgi:hypothetical protein
LDGKFFNGLLKKGDFFTAKKNEFIYKIRDGYRFATNTEWDNGKYGEFIYDEANNRYKFKECLYVNEQWQRKYFDKGLYPVLACGFIAFFIRNFENTEIIKKETDYYDKYYTPLAQKYKGKEQIKLGSEARNLDAEFYEIHIKEENNNIDQSQGLLSFIIQSERDLINGYVKGYLEHIQNIAKVK